MTAWVYNNYREFIIEEYRKCGNATVIAEQIGCNSETIRRILRKEGIPIKVLHTRHKKNFNESFFENIDSEEKAYWLGFLYADGYNYENKNRIVLGLNENDLEVLEKFKVSLQHTGNILKYPKRRNIILDLPSRKMSQDLVNKGCPQNKTYKIRFPTSDIVPKELVHHFMRGYFDGDGCITKYNYLSVTSNIYFIEEYQQKLIEGCGMSKLPIRYRWEHNKEIGYISYGGSLNLLKIYEFLYKDASLYLERKRLRFESIAKSREKFSDFKYINFNNYSIRVDTHNRISLSDLYASVNRPLSKRPADWLRSKEGKSIKLLIAQLGENSYVTQTGGSSNVGTFADYTIAIRYAAFLNNEIYNTLVNFKVS